MLAALDGYGAVLRDRQGPPVSPTIVVGYDQSSPALAGIDHSVRVAGRNDRVIDVHAYEVTSTGGLERECPSLATVDHESVVLRGESAEAGSGLLVDLPQQ